MEIHPVELSGNWVYGWALDLHTIKSVPTGVNDRGEETFDTVRTELGEAVYLMKYRGQRRPMKKIAQTVVNFIQDLPQLSDLCAIIPVPPSDSVRWFQPVPELAKIIAESLGIQAPPDYLLKVRQTSTLKDEFDKTQRHLQLQGAFKAVDKRYANCHVLVFDDLYRSGETLGSVCDTLVTQGWVARVSVIALTKTRSKH